MKKQKGDLLRVAFPLVAVVAPLPESISSGKGDWN